tara:strand:+ start:2345 stop:2557 length:213 start_codon:yes stop_codon:yes gene_type:complete
MANVVVGRLDNNRRIEVSEGVSVNDALSNGGFTKSENEVVQDIDGNEYDGNEAVVSGKAYFLIQKVKSGC